MFRRHFIQRITFAGAGSIAGAGMADAQDRKTVLYRIKGFTCVTCAVGLETMLCREKGIVRAEASYPNATVVIEFDPGVISDNSLKELISDMGFTVADTSRNPQHA
jgi:copper chaperone CopZ